MLTHYQNRREKISVKCKRKSPYLLTYLDTRGSLTCDIHSVGEGCMENEQSDNVVNMRISNSFGTFQLDKKKKMAALHK